MTLRRGRSAPGRSLASLVCALAAVLLGACAALPGDPGTAAPPAEAAAAPAGAAQAEAPAAEPLPSVAVLVALRGEAAPEPPARIVAMPRPRLDPEQDADRGDLWQRVRDGFAIADAEGPLVRKWEAYYAARPDYVRRMTERGGRFLYHIVEEVERRGLPMELALLPFIESAFNPQAMSRARAAGMWQFMPATGAHFELRQNLFRDDRRDILASTHAALDYLQSLHARFGDWQLALAAYNWGQGNVNRAIESNRKRRRGTDYASLRMPAETRNYVPKLQAVKNIVSDPERFGLALPMLENHPFFLTVAIERDIDVGLAARLAGLPLDEFQLLNPQMNKPVILAAGTPQLLLPYDNANRFVRELSRHDGPLASWTAWVAPRTLKPADAAQLVGMSEAELVEANHIPPRMLIRAGSTLLVPRDEDVEDDVAEHIAHNGTLALAPDLRGLRRVVFRAGRKGDSVAAVARRYRLERSQVAQWNRVGVNARFRPGHRIVVMLPRAPAAKAAAKRPPRPAAATAAKAPKKRAAQAAARGAVKPTASRPAADGAKARAAQPPRSR
ncbi:MAG: transglycosylase SLT domain-containing protein [Rubrivivax sp.]|nr:transglycosylase SLT domain-containing protein [Rubrivivax sp.]